MKLYEITESLKALESLADEGMDEQTIADTFEAVEGEFNDKAIAVIHVANSMDSDIETLKTEIARLSARKKSLENSKDRLKDYLRANMEASGITKIECPIMKISISKGRDMVQIDNEGMIPTDYLNIVVTKSPIKADILKALKAGEDVPGCSLATGKSSIRIS